VWARFGPDGTRIITASMDNSAKVWDAGTGVEVFALQGDTAADPSMSLGPNVWSASFSPDGSRIITAIHDKTAKVWDANSGAEVLTLKGHTSFVLSASFSSDGSRIVTGSADSTAKVWDAQPFKP
jgi:WD40 repeat protein